MTPGDQMNGDGKQIKGHGAKFLRKKEQAIAALLTCRTTEEAAKAIGISVKTLLRWQKVPEFAADYLEARRAEYSQGMARIQRHTGAATTTVLKIMVDPKTPPSVQLRAAQCVFKQGSASLREEDILVRVAALEQSADVKNSK